MVIPPTSRLHTSFIKTSERDPSVNPSWGEVSYVEPLQYKSKTDVEVGFLQMGWCVILSKSTLHFTYILCEQKYQKVLKNPYFPTSCKSSHQKLCVWLGDVNFTELLPINQ